MSTTLGRPTALTPELQQQICNRICAGAYPEVAAQAVGISPRTYYNWCKRGRDGEQPYSDFLQAVKSADAESECVSALRVNLAQPGWQAHAWRLERKYPQRWAQDRNKKAAEIALLKAKLELIEAAIAGKLPVDAAGPLANEEFDALFKKHFGQKPGRPPAAAPAAAPAVPAPAAPPDSSEE